MSFSNLVDYIPKFGERSFHDQAASSVKSYDGV